MKNIRNYKMTKALKMLLLTTFVVSIGNPLFAQGVPEQSIFIFNSLLFLIGGFLVMFMACGFCMLEAGLVRSKNTTMQLTKNISLFSLAAIGYYIIGYNLMYPLGNWSIEGYLSGFILPFKDVAMLEAVGVTAENADDLSYASTGSDYFFQLMFCAATASIVSGTVAERIKLWPFLLFTLLLTAIIYPLSASWTWGGGFLKDAGFSDFAGSTIVHSFGGWAALAGAIVLGPRLGRYVDGKTVPMLGSNLPLATLGTFILWLGWFGFNGGSQLAMGSFTDAVAVSKIFINTNLAACGGVLAAAILTRLMLGKTDVIQMLNGAIGGLVAITAEPLMPSPLAAILIGAVGGIIVVFGTKLLFSYKIDDVVGAIPAHLFAGIWGTLAVPITNSSANFGTQLLGVISINVFVFILAFVIWSIMKNTVGIRLSKEAELKGTDVSETGVIAYAIRD